MEFQKIVRAIQRAVVTPMDRYAVHELSKQKHPHAGRIASALTMASRPPDAVAAASFEPIERIREALLRRKDPLVDGSLDGTGLYDGTTTVGEACAVSKAPRPSRLLYHLVLALRPASVLELGTNVGISTAYLAAALQRLKNGGKVTTLDASPYRLRIARDAHANLGLTNIDSVHGLFADTLPGIVTQMAPIDFAFLDGHHLYAPTLSYVDTIREQAAPGAVFVFDDIRWSKGMRQAWADLRNDPRFSLVIDLSTMGICVGATADDARRYRSPRMFAVAR